MNSTPASLLLGLTRGPSESTWKRFVELYTPLVFHWSLRAGLSPEDAADCVQDVMILMIDKLPEFTYDPDKSFRGWLRTVTFNRSRDIQRHNGAGANSAVPVRNDDVLVPDGVEQLTDRDYRLFLLQRALKVMKAEFEPTTWKACWELLVNGRTASHVAKRLNISENAVYLAKSRVLRRLRERMGGLMD